MDVRQLQTELINTVGAKLTPDGIMGRETTAVIESLLKGAGVMSRSWTSTRLLIGGEQILYKLNGINVGEIDGLVGEQTRYARSVFEARRRNDGKPDASVEDWRKPDADPCAGATEAHQAWPRQRDVTSFYGSPGDRTNQITIDLPFPFRIAWDPEKTVMKVGCHRRCAIAFSRIWKKTLDTYGHEKIQALRLDMYGGIFNPRKMRGSTDRWSMHAWGIAQDVDPERNQLKMKSAQATLDDALYDPFWKIVYSEGALSLGRERGYDWMHFQFTRDFS
jgi:peptidoglycan hydrolase-like protein with peptidoglycan-binding domain